MSGHTGDHAYSLRLRPGAMAWLVVAGLAAGLAGCGKEPVGTTPTEAGLTVADPWIRAAPPTARVLAGYMVVDNPGTQAATLVGAASPLAGMVEIHETVVTDGVASMEHRPELVIPAGGQLVLEPGGAHLMFMQPSAVPGEGETVPVTLRMGDGRSLEIDFAVRAGAAAPGHEHHQPGSGQD